MAKQNVKYDSSTGKVYEELGCSGSAGSAGGGGRQNQGNTINSVANNVGGVGGLDPIRGGQVQPQTTSTTVDYSSQYQNYQQAYSSYGQQVQSQYMGSFGGAYSTNQFNPYDR